MSARWYYAVGGQQGGPVTWDELRQMAEQNKLKAADLVWNDDLPEWTDAGKVEGLVPKPPAVRMPPPLPKTATPPALPDPAQANKVTGEIRVVGTGGRTVMGIEYRVQVTLDGNVIGEGNLTDGLHIQFTTTVGNHVFALTDKRMDALAGQGGFGALLVGVSRMAGGAKAWEMKETFPVGFSAPGHYEVVFEAATSFGQPAISKNIKVNKK